MKTLLQTTGVLVLSYFMIVPPKMDRQIENYTYSTESIRLESMINSRIDTIEKEKAKIYIIQKELNIN